eukprot:4649327-Pyramimonas_sp.AAC.1
MEKKPTPSRHTGRPTSCTLRPNSSQLILPKCSTRYLLREALRVTDLICPVRYGPAGASRPGMEGSGPVRRPGR